MGIKEYFDQHPDQRLAVKWGVILALGFVVTYLGKLVSEGLINQEHVPYVMALVGVLGEKLKLLDPSKPWPLIGSRREPEKPKKSGKKTIESRKLW